MYNLKRILGMLSCSPINTCAAHSTVLGSFFTRYININRINQAVLGMRSDSGKLRVQVYSSQRHPKFKSQDQTMLARLG